VPHAAERGTATIRGCPSIMTSSTISTSSRRTVRPSRRKARGGKAPVCEVVAGVDVARLTRLERGRVGGKRRAVGLEHDLATGRHDVGQRPQERDRVGHAVQDSEAQHDVEALLEVAYGEAVHPSVFDPRARQLCDRAEACGRCKLDPEACTDPVDVLLVVDRDDA